MHALWQKTRQFIRQLYPGKSRDTPPTLAGQITHTAGRHAENAATHFLRRQGLRIVARNVSSPWGEIDLICIEQNTLVFVEVRLRASSRYGSAAESIGGKKQQRIRKTAQWWLQNQGSVYHGYACRFDALLFNSADLTQMQWIRNAFTA